MATSAAAADASGAAKLVPFTRATPPPGPTAAMSVPGAMRSTLPTPWLEKPARVSAPVLAPTHRMFATGSSQGNDSSGLVGRCTPSLPAATTKRTSGKSRKISTSAAHGHGSGTGREAGASVPSERLTTRAP